LTDIPLLYHKSTEHAVRLSDLETQRFDMSDFTRSTYADNDLMSIQKSLLLFEITLHYYTNNTNSEPEMLPRINIQK